MTLTMTPLEDAVVQFDVHTLHGTRPVRDDEPVCHVSHYEADAYAAELQALPRDQWLFCCWQDSITLQFFRQALDGLQQRVAEIAASETEAAQAPPPPPATPPAGPERMA